MDSDEIKLLLVRYITNQANEAEIKEVKHWIGLHPENELYFIELYEAWQNVLYLKPETIDEGKAYRLFSEKISPEKNTAPGLWLKIAAVVLVFLLSSVLFIYFQKDRNIGNNSQVFAEIGSVKKIQLTDGTIVWLNAGSMLKYDAGFGKTNRNVYLEGEAFFDIGHNKTAYAFLVNIKNYTIRDIGTKFNLKAYPNDPFFETSVIKGEVAVEGNSETDPNNTDRIYVKPQQVLKIYYHPRKEDTRETAQIANAYNEVSVLQIDSSKMNVYAGWKDDLLVFDGSTLGEIAKVLERRYDVSIMINNTELKNIRYSGSFKNVPAIDKVLHIIQENTPITYHIEGKKITITKIN